MLTVAKDIEEKAQVQVYSRLALQAWRAAIPLQAHI